MSLNIDWDAGNQQPFMGPALADSNQKAIDASRENYQAGGALSALNNMDWSNPQSVQAGIGALVKAGAAQQAGALSNLQVTTTKNKLAQSVLSSPQALAAAGIPTGAQPAASQAFSAPAAGQESPQQAQAILDQADQAIQGLKSTPPADLPAAVAGVRQQFIDMGVPPERIDSLLPVLPDASDPAGYANWSDKLALSHDYVQALKAHPAMGGPAPADGQEAPAMPVHPHEGPTGVGGDPGPAAQIEYLNNPGEQVVNGVLEGIGIKTDRSANARAAAEPYIRGQAELQYAAPTAAAQAAGKAQGELANPTGVDQYFVQGKNGPEPVTMTPAEALAAVRAGVPIQKALTPGQESYERGVGSAKAEAEFGAEADAYAAGLRQNALNRYTTEKMDVNGVPQDVVTSNKISMLSNPAAVSAGVGRGVNPIFAPAQEADRKDLVDYANNKAPQQRQAYIDAQNTGQRIIAGSHLAGPLAPSLAMLQQYFGGKAGDYASTVQATQQAIKGSFRDALGGLAVPRLHSEADSITGAIPQIGNQKDVVGLYGAMEVANARYRQAHDDYVVQQASAGKGNVGRSQVEQAWNSGPGLKSPLADPVFRSYVMSNGQPAISSVMTHKDGSTWGIFGKGTSQERPVMLEAPH